MSKLSCHFPATVPELSWSGNQSFGKAAGIPSEHEFCCQDRVWSICSSWDYSEPTPDSLSAVGSDDLLISGAERSHCSCPVGQLGLLHGMEPACFTPTDTEHLQGGPEDVGLGKSATVLRKIFMLFSFLLFSLAAPPAAAGPGGGVQRQTRPGCSTPTKANFRFLVTHSWQDFVVPGWNGYSGIWEHCCYSEVPPAPAAG